MHVVEKPILRSACFDPPEDFFFAIVHLLLIALSLRVPAVTLRLQKYFLTCSARPNPESPLPHACPCPVFWQPGERQKHWLPRLMRPGHLQAAPAALPYQ